MVKVTLTEIVLIKKFHKELRQYLTFFLKVEQMVTKEQPKKKEWDCEIERKPCLLWLS